MEHRLVVCAPSGVPTPLKQKSGHNVRLAHRQIARVPNSGEGGKKMSPKDLRAASQEPEYSNRSASFASVTLNPDFNFWVREIGRASCRESMRCKGRGAELR